MIHPIIIYDDLIDLSKLDMITKPISSVNMNYVGIEIYFTSKNTHFLIFNYNDIVSGGDLNELVRKYVIEYIHLEYRRLLEYMNNLSDEKKTIFFDINEIRLYVKTKLNEQ